MDSPERLARLKRFFLNAPAGWTTLELAERLGESQRTIQRDLDKLQGDPHYFPLIREGWRWRLMDDHAFELPPLPLTLYQVVALYLAGRLLARYSDEHNPHIVAALKQLSLILPEAASWQVQQSAEGLRYRRERPHVTHALEVLAEGWLNHRQVRIRYYGADNPEAETRETTLHPYLLEPSSWGLATYVIGYSTRHGEPRTFKVERMVEAELLDAGFDPPINLDLAALLESAWNVMYGPTTEAVVLRFSPAVTWRVRESDWHPHQKFEPLPHGGCRLTVPVAFPHEMKPWIRQWGPDVYVEEPAWLRTQIADEMRRAAGQYEEDQKE